MQTNLRILRARADAICAPPERTRRQKQCYERILCVTPVLLAEFGLAILTFPNLARALRISTASLRHLFIDFDELLGAIIVTHLETLLAAITAIPAAAPGAMHLRRAAYREAVRTQSGACQPAHITMRQLRHALPPDLAERATALRASIAKALRQQAVALAQQAAAPTRPCAITAARIARVNARHPLPLHPPTAGELEADAFERTYLASGRALVEYAARVLAQPP